MTVALAERRLAEVRPALEAFLAASAGARAAAVEQAAPLTGGAIQENWLIEVRFDGGPLAGRQVLVLRTDAPTAVATSRTRAQEFALLHAAREAGVTVPEPLWLCEDDAVLGRPFYVMRRVSGVALGRRVVRETGLGGDRTAWRTRARTRRNTRCAATGPISTRSGCRSPAWSGACAGASCTRRRPGRWCSCTRTSGPGTTCSTNTA